MNYVRYFLPLLGIAVISVACSDEDATKDNSSRTGGVGATGAMPSGGTSSGGSNSGGASGSNNGGVGGDAGSTSGGAAGDAGSAGAAGTNSGGSSSGGSASGGAAGSSGAAGNTSGGAAGSGGGCPTGYGECDNDPNTVCETNLSLVTSCGDCDTSCNGAQGSVECQAGQCVITACNSGYDNCDADPTNGCEQLLTDDKHCGVCGRNCEAAGTTCSAGKCQPVVLYDKIGISSDNSGAETWAMNSDSFFHHGYYNYTLRRLPRAGGTLASATNVWSAATAAAGRYSLLANDTDVTWVQRGTPSVVLRKAHTAAPGDLPTVVFTPQYQPYYLQIRGNAYYWFSGDYQAGDPGAYIYTRSLSAAASDPGTQIMSVNQGAHSGIEDFTTSSDALYWYTSISSPAEVRTTPLSGGTPTVVPTGNIGTGYAIDQVHLHTVGATLYYNRADGTSFANGIYSWNPGDAAPLQLITLDGVRDFQVDSNFIYYATSNKVFRAPLTGGAGVEIAGVGGSVFLGQDATSLYLRSSSSSNTTIYRILK